METRHQSILITGASSGIGRQLALDYAAQGIRVYACGRSAERLTYLQTISENIVPLSFDVTERVQVRDTLADLSPLPTLWIINAGDCEYIDDGVIDAALIERVMKVNVVGTANVLEAIQSHLGQAHHVVIVSSIAGEVALPRAEAYGASKAAITYLARTLQLDWKPRGVKVSCVFPGFVKTPLTDKNDFDMPMIVTTEEASVAIRKGIDKQQSSIYFPKRFTSLFRIISLFPFRWQTWLVSRLIAN